MGGRILLRSLLEHVPYDESDHDADSHQPWMTSRRAEDCQESADGYADESPGGFLLRLIPIVVRHIVFSWV